MVSYWWTCVSDASCKWMKYWTHAKAATSRWFDISPDNINANYEVNSFCIQQQFYRQKVLTFWQRSSYNLYTWMKRGWLQHTHTIMLHHCVQNIIFIIIWMALFSWLPISWTNQKMTYLWDLKFLVIVFSFIMHTENYHFVGTGIRGLDPLGKPRKLVPYEI